MCIPRMHLAAVIALQIHFQAVPKATSCLEISHFSPSISVPHHCQQNCLLQEASPDNLAFHPAGWAS